jgi:hypothetical protein
MSANISLDTLAEALLQEGFCKADEFGLFVTYEREGDPMLALMDYLLPSTAMTRSLRKGRARRISTLSW